jgi:hypothetical protein
MICFTAITPHACYAYAHPDSLQSLAGPTASQQDILPDLRIAGTSVWWSMFGQMTRTRTKTISAHEQLILMLVIRNNRSPAPTTTAFFPSCGVARAD